MEAAATAAQNEVRKSNYRALRRIQKALHPRNHPREAYVVPTILATLPIVVSDLPSHPDEQTDLGPRYSQLFSEQKLEGLIASIWSSIEDFDWNENKGRCLTWRHRWSEACSNINTLDYRLSATNAGNYHSGKDGSDGVFSLLGVSAWRDGTDDWKLNRYERQCLSDPDDHHMNRDNECVTWYGDDIYTPKPSRHPQKPHISITLIDPVVAFDASPLRSELLCIVTLMKKQMKSRRWRNHRLLPVFVYTFSGPSVRITQAVFDNDQLQVRQTKRFKIRCRNNDFTNLKLLVRWMLAEPTGNTRWANAVDEEEENSTNFQPPFGDLPLRIAVSAC